MANPQSSDWNIFWKNNRTAQPKGPSWSKKRILNIIHPFLGKGKKILDAGCGSGFFSKYFCNQGMEVVSLDYCDMALEMTREVTGGRSRIVKQDLLSGQSTKVFNEKFDIIFTDGLFEHFAISHQDKIMQNFISLLAARGFIVTFVPNRWSPWEIIRPLFMPGIHETPFILRDLIRLQERSGLSVIERGGINTLPFGFSPDKIFGSVFGMLLYTIARKNADFIR